MLKRPKRKVTYSLPEELIEDIACVVREGAAPSYSAFVEANRGTGLHATRSPPGPQ